MKTRKLNFLKIGILFFGITILLWNCEKEEIEKEVVKKSNYSVSKINFSDIKQNTQLIQKLEKFSKSKKKENLNDTQNKDVYSSEYDFTVNTDFIKYVESRDQKYHSYTFPIERDIDNGLVENLLVNLKKNGNYECFLISYNINQQEKLKIHHNEEFDLNNKVDIIKINNVFGDYFSKTMWLTCIDIVFSNCGNGNHDGGMIGGQNCPAHAGGFFRVCGIGNGGGGAGWSNSPGGGNDGENEDYLDNRGGGGASLDDPKDDQEEEEEIRISAVVLQKICDDDGKVYNQTTKNCECPKGMVEDNSGKCVKKPCVGDPVANVEIAPSKLGKKGGTFGCTRKAEEETCGGVKGDKYHSGLDIKAEVNTNTFSMYDGKVSDIRNSFSPGGSKSESYGNYILVTTIINGETVFIKYNHLNKVNVKIGDRIKAGDVIGLNGNTGNAAKDDDIIPHIHLQVFNTQWESINPLDFLTTKFDNEFNPISHDCK